MQEIKYIHIFYYFLFIYVLLFLILYIYSSKAVRMEEMKQSLLKCNYPEQLINDGIKKANSLCRYDL